MCYISKDYETMETRKLIKSVYLLLILPILAACVRADGTTTEAGDDFLKNSASDGNEQIIIKSHTDPSLHFTSSDDAIRYMNENAHSSDYSVGILPQMAKDELDYAERLLNNSHDGFIVVDKGRMKVIFFDKYGVEKVSYGMACAKNYGTKHKGWDCRTPEGFFSVKKIQNSENWHFVDENGVESKKTGEFGPRFIRLNTPVTNSVGIHGTCAPWSIGGRRTHGCIRIKNENILKLVEMVDSGMPVIVSPGKKDVAVNKIEGYDVPVVRTVVGG